MNSILHGLSMSEYRKAPGINHSRLKAMEQSPAHFAYYRDNPKPPTDDMEFGLLCDHLLFGTEFAYVESIYKEFRKDEAKLWRADQEAAGIAVFQPAKIEEAKLIIRTVLSKKKSIRDILERGKAQVALFREVELAVPEAPGGFVTVQCKGCADFISQTVACIPDLKMTGLKVDRESWGRHVYNMGYDAQAAFYSDAFHALQEKHAEEHGFSATARYAFCWIAIETDPPYEARVWVASPQQIERGRGLYQRWLGQYAVCQVTGEYPGYPDTWGFSEQPPWVKE